MHLNSLTPMRISGTPRSFLNLDSRCPTPIEAIVIGGGLENPLPTFRGGLISMNMLSPLSVVARSSSPRHSGRRREPLAGVSCSIQVATPSDVICAIRTMGHHGEQPHSRIP